MKDTKNVKVIETSGSSILAAVGYDTKENYLYVQFRKGGTYIYSEVPEKIFSDISQLLANGQSVGSYYAKNVKGKFPARKV